MKKFTLDYHNETIKIEAEEKYKLIFRDDRWLVIECREDYSKTVASSDADTRQNIPSCWVVDSTSGGPDWVNTEQLQVLGELISRKEKEYEKERAAVIE